MATQKRRIIYLSDEEWQEVRERADQANVTMSAYIRSSLVGGQKAAEPARTADRFNSRPFRPAPKKGKGL